MRKIEVVEMPEELASSMATENIYKVPNRQWRKWNQQSRFIFNHIYSQMEYQQSICHPLAKDIPEYQWTTVRWNAAWIGAEAAYKSVNQ